MILTATLAVAVVAIATTAVVVFIGLAFLPTPSRATALWTAGFALVMVGSYVYVAADVTNSTQLRALAVSLVFAPISLVWSGIRAYREADRLHMPLSIAFLVIVPVALIIASFTPAYGITFRVLFTATALFTGLTMLELRRLGHAYRIDALPLVAVAALFMVFAVVVIVDGVLVASGITTASDSLAFVRTMNLIGATVYIVCTLVTTLMLAVHRRSDAVSTLPGTFESVARDRLTRAEAAGDPWWSLIDIRLDDPSDIRAASSTAAFHTITDRFIRDVRENLPADADIEQRSPTRILALVPRAQGAMRETLQALLERIATVQEHQPVPIRLSASVGWAQTQTVGYDLDALVSAASDAVKIARAEGGDRWERVRGED